MKKIIFFILLILILSLAIIVVAVSDIKAKNNKIATFNSQFEQYLGQTMYGTEILTIINKAIDNNEKNNIEKNESGFYIENNQNTVKVELTLLSTNNEGETVEVTHQMERLKEIGLDRFIASFNLTEFECTKIEYNDEGRVSKIFVKQLEL